MVIAKERYVNRHVIHVSASTAGRKSIELVRRVGVDGFIEEVKKTYAALGRSGKLELTFRTAKGVLHFWEMLE